MKSIDVKSLLIGFLLCATFFLSVGAISLNDNIGKYQIAAVDVGGSTQYKALVLDTRTGELWETDKDSWAKKNNSYYASWRKVIKPNSF